ncbi:IS5 family transposase [Amycolatopsis sp. PS_44_ISF1]|uniref:IS5 family transposase n=1 Tax=Amycolatopsis sp. PS_44_ISF1 TaxID=2974917 RepID=UPI0028DE0AB0|nr:IS5 family transposase [Amycolatopsis sp. PS_44_ISF1]MDT8913314.1 IS5 family transposase [Amycolatopsis sp. PS_44_ISF1]
MTWAVIEPLLPPQQGGGRRWRDHRQVINAILWKLRTGAPWRDLPGRYGPWKTAHERLRLWTKDGTGERILRPGDRQRRRRRRPRVDHLGGLERGPGPPALGRRPEKRGCSDGIDALACDGEGLGRSRGGLSTKIHRAVEGRGLPVRILLTPGQAGDNPHLLPLLDGISVARLGPGRPCCRPETVIADKAYSHPSARRAMRDRRIAFVSPERADQIGRRAAKGSRGGRPPAFDAEVSKQRNVVERCFNRLNQFRDLANPRRQTRRLLPRRTDHRCHRALAPMTYKTAPKR